MSRTPAARFLDRATPPHISTLIALAGVSAMAMNLFLPSLPGMAVHFAADYWLVQLSVALYLGVTAPLQIALGPLSDRYGRRPVLLWSILLFMIATLGCIFAPTVEIFLIARMAQAAIVAALVLSRAVVRDMVPQDEAASMIGYVTMGMALAPMVAPALGGVLDEAFGWKANFWALFLSGAFLLWLTWSDLGETAHPSENSLARQVAQYPALLASRRFWGYCAAAAFASGAFFAYLGGAPYVGSEVFGLDPSALGFLFGAPAAGYMAGNYLSGRHSVRFGINRMILWGTMVSSGGTALSLALFHAGGGSAPVFFGAMTFVGLGNGLVIPNATSGMLSVRPRLAGAASGLGGAMMIGGGAALSALAGIVLVPGAGALPLVWIMFATSAFAVVAIVLTIRRERRANPA